MLKIKADFEEYLNFIYKQYVLENDENLTNGAIVLKKHFEFIINELLLHGVLEKVD